MLFSKDNSISESEYINRAISTKGSEAVWMTKFTGKDHLVIAVGDFSVTVCGRMLLLKDHMETEGMIPTHKPNRCQQCIDVEKVIDKLPVKND